jgi:phosphotransferase system HPr (HPr) family protein
MASGFRSHILLQLHPIVADARSVLSLLQLGATLGTLLVIQVVGEDEHEAIAALQSFFSNPPMD